MNRGIFGLFLVVFLFSINNLSLSLAGELDLDPSSISIQGEFKKFSSELGTAINVFPVAPAEPLGITGFDLGVEISLIDIDEEAAYWKDTIKGSIPSFIPLPKLHARKGLPWDIDLGFIYSTLPSSNISLVGGEIKKAFTGGSALTPALAVRGSYSKLMGISNLDMNTYGVDVSASKGFLFLTPYAGVGNMWINSGPNGISLLQKESISNFYYFGGAKMTLGLLTMTGEAYFSEITTYTLKIAVGF